MFSTSIWNTIGGAVCAHPGKEGTVALRQAA
jgi:hypothetical protein